MLWPKSWPSLFKGYLLSHFFVSVHQSNTKWETMRSRRLSSLILRFWLYAYHQVVLWCWDLIRMSWMVPNSLQFQRTLLKLKIDTPEGPNSVQNSGLFWGSKCFDIFTHPEVLLYIPNTRTGNDSFDFITLPQYPFDAHFEDKATTTDRLTLSYNRMYHNHFQGCQ